MAYLPVAIALEENGSLLQKQLAERAHVEQPTMAALLVRMERDGLISREALPDDKRSSRISLSAKAKAFLRGAPLAGRPATEGSDFDFDFDFMHLALLHEALGTVGECR